MDIRQLEAFAAVYSLGNFSKAGERLFLTQPTVSAHIHSLEKELGVRLFVRTTKEVAPTEAGRRLYSFARRMLRLRDDATATMRQQGVAVRETVRIAASPLPAGYLLPEWMAAFTQVHTDIPFSLCCCDSAQVSDHVAGREIDFGLAGGAPEHPRCAYRPIFTDELVVVTPAYPRYRLLGQNGFPPAALLRERMLLREEGCGLRRELARRLDAVGVQPERLLIVAEMEDVPALCRSVELGMGVSVLSRRSVEPAVQQGRVYAFPFTTGPLLRPIYLVTPKHRNLSAEAELFLEFLRTQEASGRDMLWEK